MNREEKKLMLFAIIVCIIVIALLATSITACVKYGNKPITEVPAWALYFILGAKAR